MNSIFNDLINFLTSENVKCSINETYSDTLNFRSYGAIYSVRYDEKDNEYIFCCNGYKDTESLIEAINKKCRGYDGQL